MNFVPLLLLLEKNGHKLGDMKIIGKYNSTAYTKPINEVCSSPKS